MTVGELIARLSELDADKRIVVDGYEGGYNDVTSIAEIVLVIDYNVGDPYLGDHAEAIDEPGEGAYRLL